MGYEAKQNMLTDSLPIKKGIESSAARIKLVETVFEENLPFMDERASIHMTTTRPVAPLKTKQLAICIGKGVPLNIMSAQIAIESIDAQIIFRVKNAKPL
jgi:hypothetical protein